MKLSKKRADIKDKFGQRCAYCGVQLTGRWDRDHLLPVDRYEDDDGKIVMRNPHLDTFENMMPSCPACNNYKRNYWLHEFRRYLSDCLLKLTKLRSSLRLIKGGYLTVKNEPVLFWFERYLNGQTTEAELLIQANSVVCEQLSLLESKQPIPPILRSSRAKILLRMGLLRIDLNPAIDDGPLFTELDDGPLFTGLLVDQNANMEADQQNIGIE